MSRVRAVQLQGCTVGVAVGRVAVYALFIYRARARAAAETELLFFGHETLHCVTTLLSRTTTLDVDRQRHPRHDRRTRQPAATCVRLVCTHVRPPTSIDLSYTAHRSLTQDSRSLLPRAPRGERGRLQHDTLSLNQHQYAVPRRCHVGHRLTSFLPLRHGTQGPRLTDCMADDRTPPLSPVCQGPVSVARSAAVPQRASTRRTATLPCMYCAPARIPSRRRSMAPGSPRPSAASTGRYSYSASTRPTPPRRRRRALCRRGPG